MRRAVIAVLLGLAACRSNASAGPYNPPREAARNPVNAERLNREAADLIVNDPARAEVMLREALGHDLFFGPAHNNLGVVYLGAGKLYEAASEFEWAKKLLPDSPDPRVNLALCLERAGRVDAAIESYEAALAVLPDYLPAVQGLACLTLKSGRADERLGRWLDDIAMRCDETRWREWAQLASLLSGG